jgi:hypothetical protein
VRTGHSPRSLSHKSSYRVFSNTIPELSDFFAKPLVLKGRVFYYSTEEDTDKTKKGNGPVLTQSRSRNLQGRRQTVHSHSLHLQPLLSTFIMKIAVLFLALVAVATAVTTTPSLRGLERQLHSDDEALADDMTPTDDGWGADDDEAMDDDEGMGDDEAMDDDEALADAALPTDGQTDDDAALTDDDAALYDDEMLDDYVGDDGEGSDDDGAENDDDETAPEEGERKA